jgi:hypothetical protein
VYTPSKNKVLVVYFSMLDLNTSIFKNTITSKVPKGFIYTVFIKIRYDYDSFFMAGNQFGFDFSSDNDIENLLYMINARIDQYYEVYDFIEKSIVYIQISFREMDKKLISEFYLEKPLHISAYDNISTKKDLAIPLPINEDSLGKPLSVDISNGIITKINLTIKYNDVNFLLKIKLNYLEVIIKTILLVLTRSLNFIY